MPEAPATPISVDENQREAELARFRQEHPIKAKLQDLFVNMPAGAAEGLIGIDPEPGRVDARNTTNFFTQLLSSIPSEGLGLAGMPFAWYKAKGIKPIHGTPKVFDYFDPKQYDRSDLLGWMTHAAEDPNYAAKYASGQIKHSPGRQNVIPIEPEAKNVLDLVDPNADDISQALASMDPTTRKWLIREFRRNRKEIRTELENPGYFGIDKDNPLALNERHININEVPLREHPLRRLAEDIRLTPQDTARMPFDAIRYNDMDYKSWAIPETTPIRTPWGTELTEPVKESPIRGIIHNEDRAGDIVLRKPGKRTRFNVGDTVSIVDPQGQSFAKNYTVKDSEDIVWLEYKMLDGGWKIEKLGNSDIDKLAKEFEGTELDNPMGWTDKDIIKGVKGIDLPSTDVGAIKIGDAIYLHNKNGAKYKIHPADNAQLSYIEGLIKNDPNIEGFTFAN